MIKTSEMTKQEQELFGKYLNKKLELLGVQLQPHLTLDECIEYAAVVPGVLDWYAFQQWAAALGHVVMPRREDIHITTKRREGNIVTEEDARLKAQSVIAAITVQKEKGK